MQFSLEFVQLILIFNKFGWVVVIGGRWSVFRLKFVKKV